MTIKIPSIQGYWNRRQNERAAQQKRRLQQERNPSGHSTPLFLVGCGRSGTTMLLRHLGRSWQVEAYNENQPEAFERWRLRDLPTIAGLISKSPAPVVAFKPILNTPQTHQFLKEFPEARLIFIFRHFDDVINSSMKKFGAANRLTHVREWMASDFDEFKVAPPAVTKATVEAHWRPDMGNASGAALYWLFYNRLYLDMDLQEQERVLLVCYEQMVQQPEAVFQRICAHSGITFEPELIAGIHSSSIGRDPAPDVDPALRTACEALYEQLAGMIG